MPAPLPHSSCGLKTPPTGFIIIGRNEGELLRHALRSIPLHNNIISLYVDSGSQDGSLQTAIDMDFAVLSLDSSSAFSPARARADGYHHLLASHPDLQFIHFLDADSTLEETWLTFALTYLQDHPQVAIVTGRLQEKRPLQSIFNRFADLRWKTLSTGAVDACGGIFLIRRSVYDHVRGFDTRLLTGEEADLCTRVRKAGHTIMRLDTIMAYHDSNILTFRDWCKRAIWGGYGDSLQYELPNHELSQERRRQTTSILIWTIIMPAISALALIGAFYNPFFGLLLLAPLLAYGLCFTLIAKSMHQRGETIHNAILYATLTMLRKFPYAIGFFFCPSPPDSHNCAPPNFDAIDKTPPIS